MMRLVGLLALVLGLSACKGCGPAGSSAPVTAGDLKSQTDKVSYILGFSTGKSFKEQSVDVNTDVFFRGMQEGLQKDSKPLMTEDEMRQIMTDFRTALVEKRKKESEEAGKKNEKEGAEFLAANKAKAGVVTLPSGLQYKIVKEGTGQKPGANDSVTVEYTGTSIDGKVFDSTKTRGKPATFAVGATIPGMSEALQLMPVGSEWELYIPANLGYGAQGAGKDIGPNQVLVFNVKLVSVAKPEKPADAPKPAAPAKK